MSRDKEGIVFCRVPVPTKFFTDCGWMGWSPVTGPFQNLQFDQLWWADLQGLLDGSQVGWSQFTGHFRVHSRDKFCMSITQYISGCDSFQVLGCMVLVIHPKPNGTIAEFLEEQSCFHVCS